MLSHLKLAISRSVPTTMRRMAKTRMSMGLVMVFIHSVALKATRTAPMAAKPAIFQSLGIAGESLGTNRWGQVFYT